MIRQMSFTEAEMFFNAKIQTCIPAGCTAYKTDRDIIVDVDKHDIYSCLTIIDWIVYTSRQNFIPAVFVEEIKKEIDEFKMFSDKKYPIELYSDMRRVSVEVVNFTGQYYSGLFTYPKVEGVSLIQTEYGWCIRFKNA